jgi:hypothetical protein
MSEGGRAQFTWPDPGLPRDGDAAFSRPVPAAQVRCRQPCCRPGCTTFRMLLPASAAPPCRVADRRCEWRRSPQDPALPTFCLVVLKVKEVGALASQPGWPEG